MAKKIILSLGIETTAHTFGIAIVGSDKRVYANINKTFTTDKGGFNPTEVGDHHEEICLDILKRALELSEKKLEDIDIITFSQSPGIGHCLRVGACVARALHLLTKASYWGKSLHCTFRNR